MIRNPNRKVQSVIARFVADDVVHHDGDVEHEESEQGPEVDQGGDQIDLADEEENENS